MADTGWTDTSIFMTSRKSSCWSQARRTARLKELRNALISAAVTGKIDVREEVA